jgi:hypothetical protein
LRAAAAALASRPSDASRPKQKAKPLACSAQAKPLPEATLRQEPGKV